MVLYFCSIMLTFLFQVYLKRPTGAPGMQHPDPNLFLVVLALARAHISRSRNADPYIYTWYTIILSHATVRTYCFASLFVSCIRHNKSNVCCMELKQCMTAELRFLAEQQIVLLKSEGHSQNCNRPFGLTVKWSCDRADATYRSPHMEYIQA